MQLHSNTVSLFKHFGRQGFQNGLTQTAKTLPPIFGQTQIMTSTKDIKSLRADFNRRKSNGDNAFIDFEDFKSWYEAQEKVCNYCGLKEEESQIIVTTILTSNRFPKNGKPGRGTARGMHLEVDRINPREKYSRINCTLCCYFCNNDKSDVFDGVEYKKFFQNRVNYLRQLIQNKNGV